jgi:CheY-like chemotaxis protein
MISNNHGSPAKTAHKSPVCPESDAQNEKFSVAYVFFKCRPQQSIREEKVPSSWGSFVQIRSILSGRRCLVLDDEFLIALDIQQILEQAGALHVACAASATEAIALLRHDQKFDLAVLDVKLSGPDRNSLGVAGLLAEKKIPFVFLTGVRVDDVHAKEFPQAPVIEKPYDATTLLDAVRRALAA